MENQPSPSNQLPKSAAWLVIIVIVIALGVGTYFLFFQEKGANNNNANTTNTNTVANSNTNTTINTNVDTSGWKTYTNSEYGYTMKYPSDWTYEDINLKEDPFNSFPTPIKYSIFYSSGKKYHFVIGIKKSNDQGSIFYRTGIGAGDIKSGEEVFIDNKQVPTWQLVYQNKVNEVFFYQITSEKKYVEVGNYQVRADFGINELSTSELKQIDLVKILEYREVKAMLSSLTLK